MMHYYFPVYSTFLFWLGCSLMATATKATSSKDDDFSILSTNDDDDNNNNSYLYWKYLWEFVFGIEMIDCNKIISTFIAICGSIIILFGLKICIHLIRRMVQQMISLLMWILKLIMMIMFLGILILFYFIYLNLTTTK